MKTFGKAILAAVLVFSGIAASEAARAPSPDGQTRFTQAPGGQARFANRDGGHARFAHRSGGHARFGFYFGVPLFAPAYYPYYAPPYYYPYYYPRYYAPVIEDPPAYIERGSEQPAPAPGASSESWWYYCAESQSYYPYVKECRDGWQRVAPRPPSD